MDLRSIDYNPKKPRFRKQLRGRMKGRSYRGNYISFGKYALQALEPAWITSKQRKNARSRKSIPDLQRKALFHKL